MKSKTLLKFQPDDQHYNFWSGITCIIRWEANMIACVQRWECALQCSAIWTALVALFLIVRMESGNLQPSHISSFTNGFVLLYLLNDLLSHTRWVLTPTLPLREFLASPLLSYSGWCPIDPYFVKLAEKCIFQGRRRSGYDLHLGFSSLHLGFLLKRSP